MLSPSHNVTGFQAARLWYRLRQMPYRVAVQNSIRGAIWPDPPLVDEEVSSMTAQSRLREVTIERERALLHLSDQ